MVHSSFLGFVQTCAFTEIMCVFSLCLAEEMDSNLSVLNLEPGDALPDHSTSADMVSVLH